ncbi:MAG TPA: hypothetical protein VF405_08075 [Gammaproteobacteria bacterium]
MRLKPVVQLLAVVWLVLFLASFVSLQTAETGESEQSGLARIAAFLTWQVAAFVVAMLGAFATQLAVARGVQRIKLVGYSPLAASVLLVGSYIALTAVRLYWTPFLEAAVGLFT